MSSFSVNYVFERDYHILFAKGALLSGDWENAKALLFTLCKESMRQIMERESAAIDKGEVEVGFCFTDEKNNRVWTKTPDYIVRHIKESAGPICTIQISVPKRMEHIYVTASFEKEDPDAETNKA